MNDFVKTEVVLSDESVRKILISETAKALGNVEGFLEQIVQQVLFHREPKKYSYDKVKPTFFEQVIGNSLKEMIKEEIIKIAEQNRGNIRAILKKAFKTKVVDNKEFEDRLIQQLGKYTSNISFYVSD